MGAKAINPEYVFIPPGEEEKEGFKKVIITPRDLEALRLLTEQYYLFIEDQEVGLRAHALQHSARTGMTHNHHSTVSLIIC